jgi:hypothetical protein
MLKLKILERLGQKTGPRELPDEIQAVLVEMHGVDPTYVQTLRYLEKEERMLNKRARLIRIYDPAMIKPGGPTIRHYDSLLNYRTAIVFAGHVSDDKVEITDQRIKKGEQTKPNK